MSSASRQPTSTPSSRRDRDNQSVSSSASSRSERVSGNAHQPAVESAVTRLLVSIKELLESLTLWSTLKIDENQVSDVYVTLGNDFNEAVQAFTNFGIDMTELLGVPNDLRQVLEQCLSEEATPENLEQYLPTVRQIITGLLHGLRGKQSIYRRFMSEFKQRASEQRPGHERTDSRSSRSSRRDRGEGAVVRSQLSRSTMADDTGRRTASRKDTDDVLAPPLPSSQEIRTAPSTPETRNGIHSNDLRRQRSTPAPTDPSRTDYFAEDTGRTSKPREYEAPSLPPPSHSPPPPPVSMAGPVPASVKRYSLVDKPAAPNVVIDEPTSPQPAPSSPPPPPDTPPLDSAVLSTPAVATSLAALKKSDTLERRASKRFSTYNISKMTGASARERATAAREGGVSGMMRNGSTNRRSLAVAGGGVLTAGELAVLTEVDENEDGSTELGTGPRGGKRDGSTGKTRKGPGSRPGTPERRVGTPPVPPLPTTPSRTPEPPLDDGTDGTITTTVIATGDATPASPSSRAMTVFLQLGREIKKATIEPGLSFSSLRVLFVDKFSYNPGLDNFPAIYIRDPSSGVQYELEDVDEVKERCLLSLNIEPLDQIKQHIDAQISTLSQDIKDLRTVVSTNRHSAHFPTSFSQPLAESTPARPRPSDRQLQSVARRISQYMGSASNLPSQPPPPNYLTPQPTGQSLQPQTTGGSVLSEYSSRVMSDLKIQFDEVQNLRRDLGIMRQLYTEFMKTTKESLSGLRGQTRSVKQLANAKVGGARGYIDSGKKTLDTRSQNVLTEVEKLQDTVEGVKDDVTKRHVTPKPGYFKNIKKDIDTVAAELEALKEHIKTVKPMWKKTWEEELHNIVEEQQFLTHQEEFLNDLIEDHKAVIEVYGHVEKVISIRGSTSANKGFPRNRSFKPAAPEEGHNGLSTVMLEIRGATVDPEVRLKAIEASRINREKEMAAGRSDELQKELTEFVGGKKLKMTGGAEEAERVRQRRNELTMKAMFNGGTAVVPL